MPESSEKNFKKRILFAGMPDTAFVTLHALHKAGVNIAGVVGPESNNPSYAGFSNFVHGLGLNLISYRSSLNEPDFLSKIKALNAELAVVTSYSTKFPKEFLECVPNGFVNAHPSILPEYRGANPYSHVIMNGETKTGITLHFMDENFDTGDIIFQRIVAIEPKDTMGTLFNRLNYITAQTLVEMIAYYEVNNTLPRVKQPKYAQRKAPKILPDSPQTRINWTKSAVEIERQIRALNPFLIASARFKGQFVKIFTADCCELKSGQPAGTVISIGDTIDVAAGMGVVKIRTLQLSNFIICDANDFCHRFSIQIGEKFE